MRRLLVLSLLVPALAPAQTPGTVYVQMVSHFDRPWGMRPADLTAFRSLTARHPKMRWTHLYNPAAYTQSTPLRDQMEAYVRESAVRHGAEIGLHTHMYRSLVEAAGVRFRTSPSVNCGSDATGYAVPITAYRRFEIRAVIARSILELKRRGLGPLRSYCAGFYTTSNELQSVITALGFTASGAAYPVGARFGRSYSRCWQPLAGWDASVTEMTRPYLVSTTSILPGGKAPYHECSAGPLMELPQTCKIDWMVTADEMIAVFQRHLAVAAGGTNTAVCFAVHEGTVARDFSKFDRVLSKVDAALSGSVPVVYATMSEVREAFLPAAYRKARPLQANRCELDPYGGEVEFRLQAGRAHAGRLYLLLGSLSGTSPGIRLGKLTLPLNPDPWFSYTLMEPGGLIAGSVGRLHAVEGTAAARLRLPLHLAIFASGRRFDHAFLVADPLNLTVRLTSNAVPLRIR